MLPLPRKNLQILSPKSLGCLGENQFVFLCSNEVNSSDLRGSCQTFARFFYLRWEGQHHTARFPTSLAASSLTQELICFRAKKGKVQCSLAKFVRLNSLFQMLG